MGGHHQTSEGHFAFIAPVKLPLPYSLQNAHYDINYDITSDQGSLGAK